MGLAINKYIDSALSLFKPKSKTETVIDVEVVKSDTPVVVKEGIREGAIYKLQADTTPFDHLRDSVCHAKVKAVKDGWVLYALLNSRLKEGGLFQNETMKVDTFRNIYKLTNL